MLITEHFFLIACDPRSGQLVWPRKMQDADQLAAAALILDLATQDRLLLRDGCLHVQEAHTMSHPLLGSALQMLAQNDLPAGQALVAVAQQMSPLPQWVLDTLFRRDLLHRIESRDWLLQKRVRYPLRSVQARNEALQRLRDAAHGSDPQGLALLLLADVSGLLTANLNAVEHEPAMRRLLALNRVDTQAPPPWHVLGAVRAAMLA